jgi:hypothetical protein
MNHKGSLGAASACSSPSTTTATATNLGTDPILLNTCRNSTLAMHASEAFSDGSGQEDPFESKHCLPLVFQTRMPHTMSMLMMMRWALGLTMMMMRGTLYSLRGGGVKKDGRVLKMRRITGGS